MKFYERQTGRPLLLHIITVIGIGLGIYGGLAAVFGERAVPTVMAQQDPYLSRRIDSLEQRFYGIESRLNRIEQQSRPTTVTPQILNNNDTEIQFLRTQVDGIRTRIGEVECGLLRVDERTLTAAGRATRVAGGPKESDKCRAGSGSAVQLSARQ